jgi:hypothetical protein
MNCAAGLHKKRLHSRYHGANGGLSYELRMVSLSVLRGKAFEDSENKCKDGDIARQSLPACAECWDGTFAWLSALSDSHCAQTWGFFHKSHI